MVLPRTESASSAMGSLPLNASLTPFKCVFMATSTPAGGEKGPVSPPGNQRPRHGRLPVTVPWTTEPFFSSIVTDSLLSFIKNRTSFMAACSVGSEGKVSAAAGDAAEGAKASYRHNNKQRGTRPPRGHGSGPTQAAARKRDPTCLLLAARAVFFLMAAFSKRFPYRLIGGHIHAGGTYLRCLGEVAL